METIDLIHNYPLPSNSTPELLESLALKIKSDPALSISYIPVEGLPSHREVAGRWLDVPPSRLGFGVSGHQLLTSLVLAFTKPGDAIACEEITYNGWLNITRHTQRKNVPVKSDEQGMLPASLDEAAKNQKLWGIFLMPSLHNPLCRIIPLERRLALIEVAKKHDLWIIDDDAYRFLNPSPPKSFAHLHPEKSFWIQSVTKPLFPGIKTALIAAPEACMPALTEALRATGHQPSPLTLPWVLDLLSSGKMDQIILDKQNEARKRQAIASEILKGLEFQTIPSSFHLWLKVPESWSPQGVGIVPGIRYFAGENTPPSAVRVALAGETLPKMEEGLKRIATQLFLK